jgi:hypothetical protein
LVGRIVTKNNYEQYNSLEQLKLRDPEEKIHIQKLAFLMLEEMNNSTPKLLQVGEWHLAYLYTKFAKENFHGRNPYPQRLLFVDEGLYIWKFAEAHAAACFYTGRKDEARANYEEIVRLSKSQPQFFTPDDFRKIEMNSQFFK